MENVKNLEHHDDGNTIAVILNELTRAGYYAGYRILNAKDYGNIPQNRERIYIVGFLHKKHFEHFCWPKPIHLRTKLTDIIDFHSRIDESYYYREGKFKGNVYSQLQRAMLGETIEDPGIYQWRRRYVRKNKHGLIPTITANQGCGGHNVCIVKTYYGIRKMTPRECFNAQGFPANFRLPEQMSDSRLYKQAGNSVCVPVIKRIANNMVKALNSG